MKAVVKPVSTETFENIINKRCFVLDSKTNPNCGTPFKVYVYCRKAETKWSLSDYEGAYRNNKNEIVCAQQRVACEFVCDSTANGWHISDLKIYNTPKKLSEFFAKCHIPESKCKCCDNCFWKENSYGEDYAVKKLTRPPRSWCYVEEL